MKCLIKEKLSQHRYKDNHGYLICTDCIMARTGKQTYTRDECFGDGDCSSIDVDRTEDEVFNGKTLASFENVPITIEHPDQNVDPDNYNTLSVGHMRDIHKGTYQGKPVMMGTAVITDSSAIEMVESGDLVNLSCGYDCDICDTDNPKQTNIRGNHIALCQVPRAGITKIQDSLKRKKYSVKDDYNIEEIKEAARKLHREKPYLSMKECYKKVRENIKNGNYLLDTLDFTNKKIKIVYKCTDGNKYYISANPQKIKNICSNDRNIYVLENKGSNFIDLKNGKRYLDKNIMGDKESVNLYFEYLTKDNKDVTIVDSIKGLNSMNKFRRTRNDSFDYDFDQVMYAAYEGEYDGELGQFDLPRFEKTEGLIQKLWDEKYNDIDSWLEIPWTKEEKDQIFESARNEAKLFDRMDIYNSRARYQSYDETRNVLKEVFGIDNKYLHDPKYDSCLNNRGERGNKMNKDSISKKRSHKRDAFVSAFTDKRVKDWKQVLHIYLEWEGIIGYDDIIISYLENDEYDELREFLSDEGIYGYYYTIVDIFETGEVNIPDMDEEDYERFF